MKYWKVRGDEREEEAAQRWVNGRKMEEMDKRKVEKDRK